MSLIPSTLPNFGDTGGPLFELGRGDVFRFPPPTPSVSGGVDFSSIIQRGFGGILDAGLGRLTDSIRPTSRSDDIQSALVQDRRQRRQARQAAASPFTTKNVVLGIGAALAAVVGVSLLVR